MLLAVERPLGEVCHLTLWLRDKDEYIVTSHIKNQSKSFLIRPRNLNNYEVNARLTEFFKLIQKAISMIF